MKWCKAEKQWLISAQNFLSSANQSLFILFDKIDSSYGWLNAESFIYLNDTVFKCKFTEVNQQYNIFK